MPKKILILLIILFTFLLNKGLCQKKWIDSLWKSRVDSGLNNSTIGRTKPNAYLNMPDFFEFDCFGLVIKKLTLKRNGKIHISGDFYDKPNSCFAPYMINIFLAKSKRILPDTKKMLHDTIMIEDTTTLYFKIYLQENILKYNSKLKDSSKYEILYKKNNYDRKDFKINFNINDADFLLFWGGPMKFLYEFDLRKFRQKVLGKEYKE